MPVKRTSMASRRAAREVAERDSRTDEQRNQRQRGRYLGGTPPWGWAKGADGALVPVPEKQAAIARIHELWARGMSAGGIVDALAAEGVAITLPTMLKVLKAGAGT
jgi:DNA invertase Pin-like site-specific DNA recombinase